MCSVRSYIHGISGKALRGNVTATRLGYTDHLDAEVANVFDVRLARARQLITELQPFRIRT